MREASSRTRRAEPEVSTLESAIPMQGKKKKPEELFGKRLHL